MNPQSPSFGQADLTDCDREPIRVPGSIQPHGILLALDPGSMTIVQLAGDTQRLLGRSHDRLLGQSLNTSLGATALARVESMIRKRQILPRPFFIIEAAFEGRPLEVSAHLSDGLVILELELLASSDGFEAIEAVQAMTARTDSAESLPALLDLVVAEVGIATGFDRVMLYRFREDDSGHVVAEHRRSSEVESFLDLHYPASDIPVQARELYCNNWIRSIPDVGYQPQPLNPPNNPVTGRPLDLSFSALRSVSPVHIEYLGNMGIAASASLSIVSGGKLWGLIACHHSKPLYLGARTRAALELFAQLVSLQIRSRLDLAESTARIRARDVQAQIVAAMMTDGVSQLMKGQANLLDLIPVQGGALVFEGETTLLGATPPLADVKAMADWLKTSMQPDVFYTDQLSNHYPPAAGFLDCAAGLLALSVSRTPGDYVLWFLPELRGNVTWAGNPAKSVVTGPLGDRLTPRKSFAAWTEMVQGRSRSWQAIEIESATSLRIAILDVVLRQFDRSAREQERLAKKHLDLSAAELDHQVKNTLATIQAVVRFSGHHADNIVDYTHALERRIGSLAKSHSLLTMGRWKGAPLRTLIENELSSHRPKARVSVRIVGEKVDLEPKAAMAVGLVLHELATNAVKHGSLSVEGGAVSLEWSHVMREGQDWLTLEWREMGGPAVQPPQRTGFGRTLLERVFAADVQGRAVLEFKPDGVRCVLDIPHSRIIRHAETPQSAAIEVSLLAPLQDSKPLRGLRVLVVEDGALIALDLCETLMNYGAEIVGSCDSIANALALAGSRAIDVAILDIDRNGEPVWPVAERLTTRNIPLIFATGFNDAIRRPAPFRKTATINKPHDTYILLSLMTAVAANKGEAAK